MPPPKADTPEVREAGRVLDETARLLEVTDRNDAPAAAKALRDRSWLIRKLAAIRLKVMGLDPTVAAKLEVAASPGADAPAELLAKADAFATTVKLDESVPATKVDRLEAARTVGALLTEVVQRGRLTLEARRREVSSLEAFCAAAEEKKAQRFLARRLLSLADRDAILADLKAKTDDEASKDDGQPLLAWWRANAKFCYFAPPQGRFRLDKDARAAGEPTDEFRKKTPWKKGEGPDAPAPPGSGGVR